MGAVFAFDGRDLAPWDDDVSTQARGAWGLAAGAVEREAPSDHLDLIGVGCVIEDPSEARALIRDDG